MKASNQAFSQFIIVWCGQLISMIGSGLTGFALGIYVFQLTGSATYYSMVILVAFLPSLLLKPIGGALADRIDRRLLMIIGDAGSLLGLIFIIVMMTLGITQLWPIYLGTIISSIFVALQNPAYKASITDLVHKDFYSKASGLMQLAESSKLLISPIIAGVMLHYMNIKQVLIIDAMTFLIAIVTVYWIKESLEKPQLDKSTPHFITDFISGFNYLFKNKELIWLLSIISLVTFFIGFLQALLGPMILSLANAQVLGISLSISATGMLISSCLIGIFAKTQKKMTILSIGLGFSGIFIALLGISTNVIIITLFGFLFFFALPFVNTSLDVLIRKNVENHMQGRVWAIVSLLSQLGMLIAFGIAGFLADHVFNPLLAQNGALASSIGVLIGTGAGRGIALMFLISGIFVLLLAIVLGKLKMLKELDMV